MIQLLTVPPEVVEFRPTKKKYAAPDKGFYTVRWPGKTVAKNKGFWARLFGDTEPVITHIPGHEGIFLYESVDIFQYPSLEACKYAGPKFKEIMAAIRRYHIRAGHDLPHPFDELAEEVEETGLGENTVEAGPFR